MVDSVQAPAKTLANNAAVNGMRMTDSSWKVEVTRIFVASRHAKLMPCPTRKD